MARLIRLKHFYFLGIAFSITAMSLFIPRQGLAEKETIQFFIKLPEQGVCDLPQEVMVFALDAYGLIDTEFTGLREAEIKVRESGGKIANSFSSLPKQLEFAKGKASFLITDSEPESLVLSVISGEQNTPFPAQITFREKSKPQQFQIKLASRANINQPQQGRILVLDKDGNLAIDYNRKGLTISVEEVGQADNSFSISPELLEIKQGQASFAISNTEENEELLLQVVDAQAGLAPGQAQITFTPLDKDPPEIIDIKMDALAFVELTFNEPLDDAAATDSSNYEVVSLTRQRPRNIEFHGERIILELEDLLRPYDVMYVQIENLRDLVGNEVERGSRSPDFAVPYVPINLELQVSDNPASLNTPVTINMTARCTSGRIPRFVNGQFEIVVNEAVADNSFSLSSPGARMVKGRGSFTIANSAAESLSLTISDPEGAVQPENIALEFR